MIHHSQLERYRAPTGAVVFNTKVRLRQIVEAPLWPTAVYLRYQPCGGEIHKLAMGCRDRSLSQLVFELQFDAGTQEGPLFYDFEIHRQQGDLYYGNAADGLGGEGLLREQSDGPRFQITVYRPDFCVPAWLQGALMYQIFPDRFARSGPLPEKLPARFHQDWFEVPDHTPTLGRAEYIPDDYYGGNLRGIQDKLTYLKSLGVEVLYLNPIFESDSNHRYNTGDYERIDPLLGTREDFKALCTAARACGISILLDGVFSHTGSDSRYFNKEGRYPTLGAYQSPDSPYYSWYHFMDYPDQYDCWWGFKTLPCVKELDPGFQDYILGSSQGVVRQYLRDGARGWRLDVADELPSAFLDHLRQAVKDEDPQSAVLGEVWEDATNKQSYGEQRRYFGGSQLDSVMNYPLREALLGFLTGALTAGSCMRHILSLQENYPVPAFYALMNLTGSHDVPRALTMLCGAPQADTLTREQQAAVSYEGEALQRGKQKLLLLASALYALPGAPCIYYGDEAGMQGMRDPFNRAAYPWGREDSALVEAFRALGALRRRCPALRTGYLAVTAPSDGLLCIWRYAKDGMDAFGDPLERAALCIVNRDPDEVYCTLRLPDALSAYPLWTDVQTGEVAAPQEGKLELKLSGFTARLLAAK